MKLQYNLEQPFWKAIWQHNKTFTKNSQVPSNLTSGNLSLKKNLKNIVGREGWREVGRWVRLRGDTI